jgi:xanthine dehydrogenase accessory factor
VREALSALDQGSPRRIVLDAELDPSLPHAAHVVPITCHSGGSVEIHIQPVLPPPRLAVYGASPTARALARLGKAMGYAVFVCDPEADENAFPDVDQRLREPSELKFERGTAAVFAVIATQGEWDESAIEAALSHAPDYIGVLASPRRFAEMRARLLDKLGEAPLAQIKNPVGLDLGARVPEEIALGILAEIVKEQNLRNARPVEKVAPVLEEARDPVCNMLVRVEGALHHAEYSGERVFFCCAGCRQRFLADPARYFAARPAP